MSEWKAQFRKALIDAIVSDGQPSEYRAGRYTTILERREMERTVARQGINYQATTFDEASWPEMGDTFNEGTTRVGFEADIVTLDGERYGWRYEGTLSQLIMAVVSD